MCSPTRESAQDCPPGELSNPCRILAFLRGRKGWYTRVVHDIRRASRKSLVSPCFCQFEPFQAPISQIHWLQSLRSAHGCGDRSEHRDDYRDASVDAPRTSASSSSSYAGHNSALSEKRYEPNTTSQARTRRWRSIPSGPENSRKKSAQVKIRRIRPVRCTCREKELIR
jgi:hypothetical protein